MKYPVCHNGANLTKQQFSRLRDFLAIIALSTNHPDKLLAEKLLLDFARQLGSRS